MVGVIGMKSTADLDLEALWEEMKRMTLESVKDPDFTFKKVFVRPVSSLKVKVPKESYLYPQEIEDGATPDYQKLIGDYMHFDLDLKEYVIATGITRNTIEDSDETEIRWHAARALRAMKDNQERKIVEVIDNTWLDSLAGTDPRFPPTYGANVMADPHTHITTIGGAISLATIDAAIAHIDEHGHTTNWILCNPMSRENLLNLMVDVAGYGATSTANHERESYFDKAGMEQGKHAVGRIRGLSILTNPWVTRGYYYLFDSKIKPVAWYEKRTITAEQDPRAGFGIVGTWYSNRFAVALVYATAIYKLIATG